MSTNMTPAEKRFAEFICDAHGRARMGEPTDDSEILGLFREWMAAERASAALPGGADDSPEQAEFQAACDRACVILDEIVDMPANNFSLVFRKM